MNNTNHRFAIIMALVIVPLVCIVTTEAAGSCQSDIPGDVNKDCRVNFADIAIIAAYWLQECGDGVANGQSCTFDCQCSSLHAGCIDGQCVELIDYVFIIDATSTMQDEVSALRNGLSGFLSTADMSLIDARYCIVLYGTHPELIMEFTDEPNSVINVMNSINCSGAASGLHADHNSNPNAALETIRIVLGEAVDKTLVNGPAVSSGYRFAFRSGAGKNLILVTDEDSDRPYFEFNRFAGQDTEEPPTTLTADWQSEVDAAAGAAINSGASISQIVNRSDYPSRNQFGDPALQVQDPDFSNFNPVATLNQLIANGLGTCLQAQLLNENLAARCFNIYDIESPGVIYNLMISTIE